MSILCKHVEVSGAELVRLLVRAKERQEKMSKFEQDVERPAKPGTFERIVKWIGLTAAGLFALLVLVQVVKGVVR